VVFFKIQTPSEKKEMPVRNENENNNEAFPALPGQLSFEVDDKPMENVDDFSVTEPVPESYPTMIPYETRLPELPTTNQTGSDSDFFLRNLLIGVSCGLFAIILVLVSIFTAWKRKTNKKLAQKRSAVTQNRFNVGLPSYTDIVVALPTAVIDDKKLPINDLV
jgi:hypothetical protein